MRGRYTFHCVFYVLAYVLKLYHSRALGPKCPNPKKNFAIKITFVFCLPSFLPNSLPLSQPHPSQKQSHLTKSQQFVHPLYSFLEKGMSFSVVTGLS